jgi:hypothetical protein
MKIINYTIYIFLVIFAYDLHAISINKVTYALWDKPDVEILYALPKKINENTKVIFIIHGASRDVEKYLNQWIQESQDKNVILVAPHFTKENYPYFATLGMTTSSGRTIKNQSNHLRDSVSSFYNYFQSKYNLKTNSYLMFGFSAGSQFVHRYLMYGEDMRARKVVLGSAGWYTFLNNESFPYGIRNMPVERERFEWFLSRQVLFVLGVEDDDSNHKTLNLSRGARKQGNNRYERGKNYFDDLIGFGENNGIPFRWRYKSVPGLNHNTEAMSQEAIPYLLEGLDY